MLTDSRSSSTLKSKDNDQALQHSSTQRSPLFKSTAHWGSNYGQAYSIASIDNTKKAERASWTKNRPAYSCKRGTFTTEHESMFGKYGDSPRVKLGSDSTEVAVEKTEGK